MGGYEGRTIFFIRGGVHADQWTSAKAYEDGSMVLLGAIAGWGPLVEAELREAAETLRAGREHYREYERLVRVTLNFLLFFNGPLGEAQAQARTADENEGIEIRDLIFANKASHGFWKDLKDKWAASEIVVDCKNTEELTREDLRQLYCYLKPVLGFFGIIVCRREPPAVIRSFNRTLIKNFKQERMVLILSDDDLRRMVAMVLRGHDPSEYLHQRYSELLRSI